MPTSGIHETAIIHPSANIGKDVSVGPYAVIDEDTEIGDGCVIGAHVTIHPYTKIGKNCHFFPGCSIGAVPQDLKFVGEKSYTIIGDGGSFHTVFFNLRGEIVDFCETVEDRVIRMVM